MTVELAIKHWVEYELGGGNGDGAPSDGGAAGFGGSFNESPYVLGWQLVTEVLSDMGRKHSLGRSYLLHLGKGGTWATFQEIAEREIVTIRMRVKDKLESNYWKERVKNSNAEAA